MHGPGCRHARVQLDLAVRLFVIREVLLQNVKQRFGLLWAHVDSLKIRDLNLGLGLLLQRSEDQKKIPHAGPDLNAVGIAVAIAGGIDDLDIRLYRHRHDSESLLISLTAGKGFAPWPPLYMYESCTHVDLVIWYDFAGTVHQSRGAL